MDEEQLIAFLRENLSLRVKTTSQYNGGMGDGPAYDDVHTVQLILCGEVISEDWL